MKQTLVRYAIVASIGAFIALMFSSCGTTTKHAQSNHFNANWNARCSAYN